MGRVRIGLAATELLASADRLLPEEREIVAGASPRRVAEFATGRECARVAMSLVGAGSWDTPLLRDRRGAPSWPAGVLGSITHCTGWIGAVAAPTGRSLGLRGIGLDAEPRAPLPSGVLEVVASEAERAAVGRLAAEVPGIPWDTLLFSAKEAAYKASYALTGEVLGHGAVSVRVSSKGRFTAAALGVRGRWTLGPRVIVTIAVIS
jgi:4'-phosphopantetheinyl transferase EntD